jgi:hypothetical protein
VILEIVEALVEVSEVTASLIVTVFAMMPPFPAAATPSVFVSVTPAVVWPVVTADRSVTFVAAVELVNTTVAVLAVPVEKPLSAPE